MKHRAEINKIENKTIEKNSKTKSWVFKKINKIGIFLGNLSRKKEEKYINKIRSERVYITTDAT